MVNQARIVLDGDLVRVYFDYNESLVDALKETLPRHARWWDKLKGCWFVKRPWLDDILALLDTFGYRVTTKQESAHQPPPSHAAHPRRLTAECLTELFTAYHADPSKLHRCLALGFHPDHHGGDGELMRLVNRAYDLRRQR